MRLVHRWLALGGLAGTALLATTATASARTIDVFPGHSIQAAVNRAHSGDVIDVHPGVYQGSVAIKKDDLALRGAGDANGGTVIKPRAHTRRCGHGHSGICISRHRNANGHLVATAGTRISDLRVEGFRDFGAVAQGAKDTIFRDNSFVHNDVYGVAAFGSHKTRFVRNVAKNGAEAGFYVGDSPDADVVLRSNRASRNGEFGFFLRDSSHAVAVHNRAAHNCLGIGVINTGAPGGARNWTVRDNVVRKNSRRCPGGEEGPPISGTGIVLLGAKHTRVRGNLVVQNVPTGPAAFAGGIVVASSTPLGGTDASHNRIVWNFAFRNHPDDLIWDGNGAGNVFRRNRCDTSAPRGLCN